MDNYNDDEFFMNASPMPAFPEVDYAYHPWLGEQGINENHQQQQPALTMPKQEPEYHELRPVRQPLQQLQPLIPGPSMQPLQQTTDQQPPLFDIPGCIPTNETDENQPALAMPKQEYHELRPVRQPVQQLQQQQPLIPGPSMQPLQQTTDQPPPSFDIPPCFPVNETDVFSPSPSSVDFRADSYMAIYDRPVELEAKPVEQKTRGRKRKQAEGSCEEEADWDTTSNMGHADYDWREVQAKPVKRRASRRKGKQAAVSCEEETEWDASFNMEQPEESTETGETGAVFCNVVGRLCVMTSLLHYDITTDELRRRAAKPERLTHTHLGTLLKRGKVKGNGDELKQLLEEQQIALLPDALTTNRKQYPLTTLSALFEGESLQLSTDHRELALAHFPVRSLALLIMRSTARSPAEAAAIASETSAARAAAASFSAVLDQWTAGGWAEAEGRAAILASPLRTFALGTHALGVEECLLMATIFENFLDALEAELVALLERVNAAGFGVAAYLQQFPAGIEVPPIPDGIMHLPDESEESGGSAPFTEITGRLSLNNQRYSVSVAEIYRRVRHPECYNLSILGSFLKRGKTAKNCQKLHDELRMHKINLSAGRRKTAKNRTFTALLEGEAVALAHDMEREAERSFPGKELIASIVADTPRDEIDECRYGFESASRIARSLLEAVRSLELPIAHRIPDSVKREAHIIFKYCQLTHGYGPAAVISWMEIFSDIFEKTAKELSRA